LGSTVAGTEVSTSAELIFTGATSAFTTNEPIQISGNGSSVTRGAIVVENGANVTLGGTITLAADATVTVAGDSSVTYSNPISFTTILDRNLTLQGATLSSGNGGTIAGAINLGAGGLTKEEGGKWTLGGANAYSGFTAVNAGTLVVSGSLSGTTQVDVTGTLGGNGTITPALGGSVSIIGGGKLAPCVTAGTLSIMLSGGGKLDIGSGVFGSNSQSLLFELGAPSASDKVALSGGALSIGSGVLEFNDFVFSTLAGFEPAADYVLFDGSVPIVGTLGAGLTGTVAGFTAEIQLADSGKDIILHVIPEPGSAGALLAGITTLLGLRRRRI
jgi:autotransporter-associated beta strand protein